MCSMDYPQHVAMQITWITMDLFAVHFASVAQWLSLQKLELTLSFK